MLPETFTYTTADTPVRERVVSDPARWGVLIAHVVLPPGDLVPEHEVDADAFFIVVRGTLTLWLGEVVGEHARGTIVHLPVGTKMKPTNVGSDVAEFFVVKTPHP